VPKWVTDRPKSYETGEAPRAQRGASRKGDFFYIVPLDPAYKAGLAGHLPVTMTTGQRVVVQAVG